MARKTSKQIGARIRELRVQAGKTQLSLALTAEIAPETLSRIERNHIAPSPLVVNRLAQALGVTVEELHRPAGQSEVLPLRESEVRLLNLVRELDDAEVDDLVKGLRIILRIKF